MTDKTTPERQPVADALPPLPDVPEPWDIIDGEWCGQNVKREVFTVTQLRAYATEYARAALASRDAELEALKHDIAEALKTISEYEQAADVEARMADEARAELAALRQGEPVAIAEVLDTGDYEACVKWLLNPPPFGTALYEKTSPPPAQPPQAEPLSEAYIDRIFNAHQDAPTMSFRYYVTRDIERLITERMSAGETK